jgi:hypothetical protein
MKKMCVMIVLAVCLVAGNGCHAAVTPDEMKALAAQAKEINAATKDIAEAVAAAPYSGGNTGQTLIEAAQAANAASAPWNPYAGIIAAALALGNLVLGYLFKRKAADAAAAATTTVDVVNSVSVLLEAIKKKEVTSEDQAKALLKGAQDTSTRAAVNLIKAELKEPLAA